MATGLSMDVFQILRMWQNNYKENSDLPCTCRSLAYIAATEEAFVRGPSKSSWRYSMEQYRMQIVQAMFPQRGRGGVVSRLLASHLGEPGSIPIGVASGFLHVVIVPDDAADRQVFSGISRFPRACIPVRLQTHLASPPSALKTSLLRTAQISPRTNCFRKESCPCYCLGDEENKWCSATRLNFMERELILNATHQVFSWNVEYYVVTFLSFWHEHGLQRPFKQTESLVVILLTKNKSEYVHCSDNVGDYLLGLHNRALIRLLRQFGGWVRTAIHPASSPYEQDALEIEVNEDAAFLHQNVLCASVNAMLCDLSSNNFPICERQQMSPPVCPWALAALTVLYVPEADAILIYDLRMLYYRSQWIEYSIANHNLPAFSDGNRK
ncbi:hypothetical protein PR048_016834 [Dryococelus australis]|uniref:Uncharacterized protein n=1 Tax=Dryococelus australis TaxID=614101 RepID=A0ABQ9H7T1_9NEOP|nr:hypothetical protein PR048_016834 [Dryococelus australis]